MITAVIGHRGTGKTELMSRLHIYLRDHAVTLFDLDTEIEKKIGKTIPELFLERGESYFRDLERQMFLELLQRPDDEVYIVLGAGFDVKVIPEEVRVLWVKRTTDLDGRIFLNRPRLNPDVSPLEEFRKRAFTREQNYRSCADEVYLMPEGSFANHHQAMAVEKMILTHSMVGVAGCLTILPDVFTSQKRWNLFKARYQGRGISLFELRDDLLSHEQILQALQEMPEEKFIYSFRKIQSGDFTYAQDPDFQKILDQLTWVDWAWELGAPDRVVQDVPKEKIILSLHQGSDFSAWSTCEPHVGHLKFSPEILNFSDLEFFHQWQRQSPHQRSFLPRSASGRWAWYRLLQKNQQLINFWKEDNGSATDQPSLWYWLMAPVQAQKFAAVLGSPVAHSFTPLEHSDFFHKRKIPVWSLEISREEWDQALPVLQKLGLTYAAVTAPHKENAARLCAHQELKAVNTLFWNQAYKKWLGTSTDEQGFLELIDGVGMIAPLQKEIFVWGGGGTLEMLQKALPHASYFSSRTGEPRPGSESAKGLKPKIVIWAAPRGPE
ncbi:MAG: shikimate synthase, partial [Bdellovibrio sp.]|nr:shikimate synthase [Bdellovibrio sp.]